jgi:hypothetical protein
METQNIVVRMISSIPIVGPFLALGMEHLQMGLLRGAVVGLIIAVALIAASEAVIAAFDVGREWVSVHITSSMKTAIRGDFAANQDKEDLDKFYAREKKRIPGQVLQHTASVDQPVQSTCANEPPIAGCFWATLPHLEKCAFVLGAHDAIHKNYDGRKLFPAGSFEDLVRQLDEFYKDPAHEGTLVIDALQEMGGQ